MTENRLHSLKTFREIIFTKFFVKVISRKNKVKTDSITISWVAPLFNAILTHKCADKWREIVNFCYSSKMHKSVFKTFFFFQMRWPSTFIRSSILYYYTEIFYEGVCTAFFKNSAGHIALKSEKKPREIKKGYSNITPRSKINVFEFFSNEQRKKSFIIF